MPQTCVIFVPGFPTSSPDCVRSRVRELVVAHPPAPARVSSCKKWQRARMGGALAAHQPGVARDALKDSPLYMSAPLTAPAPEVKFVSLTRVKWPRPGPGLSVERRTPRARVRVKTDDAHTPLSSQQGQHTHARTPRARTHARTPARARTRGRGGGLVSARPPPSPPRRRPPCSSTLRRTSSELPFLPLPWRESQPLLVLKPSTLSPLRRRDVTCARAPCALLLGWSARPGAARRCTWAEGYGAARAHARCACRRTGASRS